jgi:hypothetical protein
LALVGDEALDSLARRSPRLRSNPRPRCVRQHERHRGSGIERIGEFGEFVGVYLAGGGAVLVPRKKPARIVP